MPGSSGLIVVDRYQALLWAKVFKKLKPHEGIVVHAGGDLAWMIRKDSPKLKAEIAEFAKNLGPEIWLREALLKKYGGAGNPRVVKQATSSRRDQEISEDRRVLPQVRHSVRYGLSVDDRPGVPGIPARSERRSDVGAIGVMQLMPATGKEMKTGDITQLEPNIHAGIKYIRLLQDQFFETLADGRAQQDPVSFAAYNAGPAGSRNSGRKRSNAGSIQTSGSTTSRSSPRDESGRKQSRTWPTFTSTTMPISWSRSSGPKGKKPSAR